MTTVTALREARLIDRPAAWPDALVLWLDQVGSADASRVGAKAATLGDLSGLGIPVPPGFVVTRQAHRQFFRASRFDRLIAAKLADLDPDDVGELHRRSKQIRDAIRSAPLPPPLDHILSEAIQRLNLLPSGSAVVAVRASGPSGDAQALPASRLGVRGHEAIQVAVRELWADCYQPDAILDRLAHGQSLTPELPIIVQALVDTKVSGRLITLDAERRDRSALVVEAIWGLGGPLRAGALTPDRYRLGKDPLTILERAPTSQSWQLGRQPGQRVPGHQPVPAEQQDQPKLTDAQLLELGRLALRIEDHYQFPQVISWLARGDQLSVVRVQPIPTTPPRSVRVRAASEPKPASATAPPPLLVGRGITPGWATGPVRLIHRSGDLEQVRSGEVVVARLARPELEAVVGRAAAVITDAADGQGILRDLTGRVGRPSIAGTGTATHLLHEGQLVTVDGTTGRVYRGRVAQGVRSMEYGAKPLLRTAYSILPKVRTATQLLISLDDPHQAAELGRSDVDGVGLLRAEPLLIGLGEHPAALLADDRREGFISQLAAGIQPIAQALHPHPVLYRASNLTASEYRILRGGQAHEVHEENPLLGLHGAARAIARPELFQLELAALALVRNRHGYDNLSLLVPFVRSVEELVAIKRLVDQSGLGHERTFQLWLDCQVPSAIFAIDELIDVGVDGLSINPTDLGQLLLGIDRANAALRDRLRIDEPAILAATERLVRVAVEHHTPVNLLIGDPTASPQVVERLLALGVTSLTVSPESASRSRELLASIEHHLATGAA